MLYQVTYKSKTSTRRQNYQTHRGAISAINRWYGNNDGIVMLYQPNQPITVYNSIDELPLEQIKKKVNFYNTKKWLRLRYEVLQESNGKCSACGRSLADKIVLEVDHIKPRSKYPALALDRGNLQVLCRDCNSGKSDRDFD